MRRNDQKGNRSIYILGLMSLLSHKLPLHLYSERASGKQQKHYPLAGSAENAGNAGNPKESIMFYKNIEFDLSAFSVLPARDILFVLQPGLASLTDTWDGKAVSHVSEVFKLP